jgi:hypothetical protein
MSTTRKFTCDDLLKFNDINLDVLTETVRRMASDDVISAAAVVHAVGAACVCAQPQQLQHFAIQSQRFLAHRPRYPKTLCDPAGVLPTHRSTT